MPDERKIVSVLFVFGQLFQRGGTETVMGNIFDAIDRSRFHIDFLILEDGPDGSDLKKRLEAAGSSLFYIVRRGIDHKKHKAELKSFFDTHRYEIVHTHMDAIGDEVMLEAKRHGVPVRVAHSHSTDQLADPHSLRDYAHKGYLLYERFRLRWLSTHYAACSSEAGAWLFGERICKGENYLLFRNAFDPDRFAFSEERRKEVRESLGLGDVFVLGHIGTFNYQKNHSFLLEVFAEVCKNIEARLVLVGAGELQGEAREKTKDLGIEDRVLFLGSRGDVPDCLQAFDVFCFPSRSEGLGLALLEAETSGLPCLVSDKVPREVAVIESVKFLDIEGGAKQWVNALTELAKERPIRRSQVERMAAAGYDMRRNVRELEAFYEKALASRRG